MYAGRVVEKADVNGLFDSPKHPYTVGLLESLPRFDEEKSDLLQAIPGQPPDLAHIPDGCAFRPRCPYSIERCTSEDPKLTPVSGDRLAACLVDVDTAERKEVEAVD